MCVPSFSVTFRTLQPDRWLRARYRVRTDRSWARGRAARRRDAVPPDRIFADVRPHPPDLAHPMERFRRCGMGQERWSGVQSCPPPITGVIELHRPCQIESSEFHSRVHRHQAGNRQINFLSAAPRAQRGTGQSIDNSQFFQHSPRAARQTHAHTVTCHTQVPLRLALPEVAALLMSASITEHTGHISHHTPSREPTLYKHSTHTDTQSPLLLSSTDAARKQQ